MPGLGLSVITLAARALRPTSAWSMIRALRAVAPLMLLLLVAACTSGPASSDDAGGGGGGGGSVASTTTLTSATNPSVYGQGTTLVAKVSGADAVPGGIVTFLDGQTVIGASALDASGSATLQAGALAVGTHPLSAAYGGQASYAPSASPTVAQVVAQAQTATVLAAATSQSQFGQSVTFSIKVNALAPGAGTPTGLVTVMQGADVLGSATLDLAGSASFSGPVGAAGSASVTAVYAGDASFAGSTSLAISETVGSAKTIATLTTSKDPFTFGQSVTFSATVVAAPPGSGAPTGTVTFQDGATTLGTGTLDAGGTATFTTATLAPGNHTVFAVYGGDANFAGSFSGALTEIGVRAGSAVVIVSAKGAVVRGEPVVLTATVTGVASAALPTGTVTFLDGTTALGTATLDAAGIATLSVTMLSVGAHSLDAAYGGDVNYAPSTGGASAAVALVVSQAASALTLVSDTNPSSEGLTVSFSATVAAIAPGAGTPTGTVTFLDGATVLGSVKLAAGVATLPTAALTAGTHAITASYEGDPDFTASASAELSEQVFPKGAVTLTVSSSVNPAVFGQPIVLTGRISPTTTTGVVTFKDNGVTLGSAALDGVTGVVTLASASFAAPLSTGTHTIAGSYAGNATTGPAVGTVLQIIGKSHATVALDSSRKPSTFGQAVTFTAIVGRAAPGAGVPTGTVTFHDTQSAVDVTLPLDATGVASLTTTSLSAATHVMTAAYGGDASFSAANSAKLNQQVDAAATTTTLASSLNPSTYGAAVKFTVTVASAVSGLRTPTGNVVLLDGGSALATQPLDVAGNATFSVSSLGGGTHAVTAAYNGDGADHDFATSTSAAVSQVVKVGTTAASISVASSANPSVYGQPVTFTATVTSGGAATPTGSVSFKNGPRVLATIPVSSAGAGSATASFTTSSLLVGAAQILAVYGGDASFTTANSNALSQTVAAAGTTVSIVATPNPANVGQPVDVVVQVTANAPGSGTPVGRISFADSLLNGGAAQSRTLDVSGRTTIALSDLIASPSHALTANYQPGSPNFAPSNASKTLSVRRPTLVLAPTGVTPPFPPLHAAQRGTLALTATLTGSAALATDTIAWSLNANALGTLSVGATTRTATQVTATATYTAPNYVALPDAVTVRAAGASAAVTIKTDPPLSHEVPPLAGPTAVPDGGVWPVTRLDRAVDFAIFGADNAAASGKNEVVLAPTSARGNFDGTGGLAGGVDHPLFEGTNVAASNGLRKVALSANLDDDVQEETVVLSWNPGGTVTGGSSAPGGAPTISIMDPYLSGGTLHGQTLQPQPMAGTTPAQFFGPTGWFDFDLALADVDGDGYAEIIVTGTNVMNIFDPATVVSAPGAVWVFDDLHNSPAGKLQLLAQASITGDFDGTIKAQGALVARVAAGSLKKDGSTQIAVAWIDANDWQNAWNGCAGNCNEAGVPQAHYQLFSYAPTTLAPIGGIQRTYYDAKTPSTAFLSVMNQLRTSNVIGVQLIDLDGNGVSELVLGGWNTRWNGSNWTSWVRLEARGNLDQVTSTTDAAALPMLTVASSTPAANINFNHPPSRWLQASYTSWPATGGAAPSRAAQIIAGGSIAYWGPDGSTPPVKTFLWNQPIASSTPMLGPPSAYYYLGQSPGAVVDDFFTGQTFLDVRAGDVNGDGREDLIVMRYTGEIDAYGYVCVDPQPCAWTRIYTYAPKGPGQVNAVLSPAAWDGDSTTVQFTGEHTIGYGSNKILALLAAPPAVDPAIVDLASGIPVQNNSNNTFTIFGQMYGITSGTAVTAGAHLGAVFGFDFEASTGLIANVKMMEIKLALTVQAEVSHTTEWSRDTTFTVEYGQGIGADGVIFSTVPYDRYVYTVVSDLDPKRVGKRIEIDLPKPAQVLFVDRDFFNDVANVGSFQITRDLLKNRPYDMTSYPKCTDYPTAATTSAIPLDLGNGVRVYSTIEPMGQIPAANQPAPVYPPQWSGGSAGGSFTTVTLESSSSTSQIWSESLDVDFSAEFTVGTVVSGFNAGFCVGSEQSTSFTRGLSFSGTAGSILNSYVSQYQYDFRLFAYRQTLTDATGAAFQRFYVVNYGVDALGSAYSPQASSSSCVY